MSANFMPGHLVRQFHVRQIHVRHFQSTRLLIRLLKGRYQVLTTWMGDCRRVNCLINIKVNSAFYLFGVDKSVYSVNTGLTGVMAGRVHPCRVAGSTV